MGFLAVILAATATFAFGALWYGMLSKPWLAASGVPQDDKGQPANGNTPTPYVICAICILLVAGMMRHAFALSGIDTLGEGLVTGFGIGAFFITPWLALTNGYTMRPHTLTAIDGGYASIGCAIMGAVLVLL